MNNYVSRFRAVVVLTVIALILAPAATINGAQVEPTVSFPFDENDTHLSPYQCENGVLSEITDFTGYSYKKGQKKQCLYMDGSYGLKLDIGRFNSKDYTISFWIKPDEITAHIPILSIVNKDFDKKNYTTVLLDENWLQPNITSIYTDYEGSSSYSTGISGALNPDIWTHIALVVTTSPTEEYFDNMTLYIDGEYACDGLMLKNLFNSNSTIWIGIDPYNDLFKGCIDELHIFNSALTSEDIHSIYKADFSLDNNHDNNSGHSSKPNSNNTGRPGHHGNNSGNIFDDIIQIDQGSLPDSDNSSLSSYLDPGLAAGMEYKTNAFADTAAMFALIMVVIALCCFLTYIKKKRNQY